MLLRAAEGRALRNKERPRESREPKREEKLMEESERGLSWEWSPF